MPDKFSEIAKRIEKPRSKPPKPKDRFLTRGESGTMSYFPHESVRQWDSTKEKNVDDTNRCAKCDHRLSGDEYGICKDCFEKATNGVPVAPREE